MQCDGSFDKRSRHGHVILLTTLLVSSFITFDFKDGRNVLFLVMLQLFVLECLQVSAF